MKTWAEGHQEGLDYCQPRIAELEAEVERLTAKLASTLDEPMFPQMTAPCPACQVQLALAPGKPARVYAAIHLCVPESGDPELDAMIRKAQRQRLAAIATEDDITFQLGTHIPRSSDWRGAARCAYADALLAELEKP